MREDLSDTRFTVPSSSVPKNWFSDLAELPIVDGDRLTAFHRSALHAAVKTLKSRQVHPIRTQLGTADPMSISVDTVTETQHAIDEIVLCDLGLPQKEQEQVYRTISHLVADRLGDTA